MVKGLGVGLGLWSGIRLRFTLKVLGVGLWLWSRLRLRVIVWA